VLIAARDESVTVRCPAGVDDELHWVKLTPAAAADDDDDDNDERWVEVSRRRRLVLDAGVQDRDGVYLCVVTNTSSSTPSARLAANVTVISPCKHPDLNHTVLLLLTLYSATAVIVPHRIV